MSEINDTEEIPQGKFPINIKLIEQYQQKNPRLLAKYKEGTYKNGSVCGESNVNHIIIMCKDKILIFSALQSKVLH